MRTAILAADYAESELRSLLKRLIHRDSGRHERPRVKGHWISG